MPLASILRLLGFRKRYGACGGSSRAWPQGKRIRVHLIASTVPRYLDPSQLDAAILRAVIQWRSVCGVDLHHIPHHAKHTGRAEILIRFGQCPGREWDGEGGNLAFAFFPPCAAELPVHGDIYLDPNEPWTVGPSRFGLSCDFAVVILHELGHAIGLPHSPCREDVMHPHYRANADSLASGDISQALRRYPRSASANDT